MISNKVKDILNEYTENDFSKPQILKEMGQYVMSENDKKIFLKELIIYINRSGYILINDLLNNEKLVKQCSIDYGFSLDLIKAIKSNYQNYTKKFILSMRTITQEQRKKSDYSLKDFTYNVLTHLDINNKNQFRAIYMWLVDETSDIYSQLKNIFGLQLYNSEKILFNTIYNELPTCESNFRLLNNLINNNKDLLIYLNFPKSIDFCDFYMDMSVADRRIAKMDFVSIYNFIVKAHISLSDMRNFNDISANKIKRLVSMGEPYYRKMFFEQILAQNLYETNLGKFYNYNFYEKLINEEIFDFLTNDSFLKYCKENSKKSIYLVEKILQRPHYDEKIYNFLSVVDLAIYPLSEKTVYSLINATYSFSQREKNLTFHTLHNSSNIAINHIIKKNLSTVLTIKEQMKISLSLEQIKNKEKSKGFKI